MSICDASEFETWSDDGYEIASHWDFVADDDVPAPPDLDGLDINALFPVTPRCVTIDGDFHHGLEWREPSKHGYWGNAKNESGNWYKVWRQCNIHQGFWLCVPCSLERLTKGRVRIEQPPEEWKSPQFKADPDGEWGRFDQSAEIDGHRLALVRTPPRGGHDAKWLVVHTEFVAHRPVTYRSAEGQARTYRAEDRDVVAYMEVHDQYEGSMRLREIAESWRQERERQTAGVGWVADDGWDPWDPANRPLSSETLAAIQHDRAEARRKVNESLARMGEALL